jgi:hypothetical protein
VWTRGAGKKNDTNPLPPPLQLCSDGVGADAAAIRHIMGRLLHRSLHAPRGLTQHPASGGARARLARRGPARTARRPLSIEGV